MSNEHDLTSARRFLLQETYLRAILIVVVLQGLAVSIYILTFESTRADDFQAFYFAARRALAGEDFMGLAPPTGANTAWVFAPIILVYFLPLAFFSSWQTAYMAQFAVILLVVITAVLLLSRQIPLSVSDCTKFLFIGAVLFNPYSVVNFAQGQMNAHLLLGIVLGVIWIQERQEIEGGIVLGLAALLKLWPVFLGLWLLYRRAWRAVVSATVTGIGGLVAGIILFGSSTTVVWLTDVLARRGRLDNLAAGLSPNSMMIAIERSFAALVPGLDPVVYLVAASSVSAAVLLFVYWQTPSETAPWAVAGTTICVTLLAVPAAAYHYLLVPISTALLLQFKYESPILRLLLGLAVVVAGTPIFLQELLAVGRRLGLSLHATDPLILLSAAVPPPVVGLVLLTVGHAMATTYESEGCDNQPRQHYVFRRL